MRRGGSWRLGALALLLGATVLPGCVGPQTPTVPAVSLPERLHVRSGGRVIAVALDEYVAGSILAEVSPVDQSAETTEKVFEIQAILARTYAVAGLGRHRADGFDLCDSTHCQVYDPARLRTSRFAGAARDAVRKTSGQILTFAQRPVEAVFHADCGGYTAAAESVWGGRVPYLLSEPDQLSSDPHKKWRVSVTADKLRAALNANAASAVGKRLDDVRVTSRDASGRINSVAINGEHQHTVRGEQLRTIVNASLGDRTMQSTKVTISRNGSSYVFEGAGFGHGVGLCQVGAAARAKRGDSVEDILAHYFPGARLTR